MTPNNVFIALGCIVIGVTLGGLYFNSRRNLAGGSKTRAAGLLKRYASVRKYKVLDDVTLEGKKGRAHVDHILVGEFGVLFITVLGEVGSYYGSEEEENWAIVTSDNTRKRIPNPLKAGEAAMDAMRGILVKNNVYNIPMEQLVVVLPSFNEKREFCVKQSLPVINVRKLSSRLTTNHFEADNGVDVEKIAALITEASAQ